VNNVVEYGGMYCNGMLFDKQGLNVILSNGVNNAASFNYFE
jgi:hypothetical protein